MRVEMWIRRSIAWLGGREPVVLLSLVVVMISMWAFIKVTSEVLEGDTQAVDEWVIRSMRQADNPAVPIGPPWLQEMGRDATALGGVGWLFVFTLIVAGYLWIDRKLRMMVFLLTATASGFVLSLGLKQLFNRPRPEIVPHLSIVSTSSFPSGHSLLSAVVYLTIGSLLATVVPRTLLKIYVLTIAVLLSTVVGISRVYLGVHYPSDVIAGLTMGLVWALACSLVARWLQQRGQIDEED